MNDEDKERALMAEIKCGALRVVHTARARKLRRKGVFVWYSHIANAYVWRPSRP